MKKGLLIFALLISCGIQAQIQSDRFHSKSFQVKNDTVKIDTVSISPILFKVLSTDNKVIDTTYYFINYSQALLVFNKKRQFNEVIVEYFSYPEFLTKNYFKFSKNLIVPKATNSSQLYSLSTNQSKIPYQPFEGLNTSGNISRGLTIGNNQNAVVNSTLDLQIAGKISDKVTLKAYILDTNIPIQENGNTFKLNEFDRVFIELSSDNWRINAGDVYLNNRETSFLNFNKKVSGLSVSTTFNKETSKLEIQTSGAIVKGKYNKVEFNGIEGNQGPYKLTDQNDNVYVLILSGTDQIYVNGQLIKRGENNDYIIDYNTAEITFSTTFPITGDMRISAEYQFTDRVYTRFVTYNKVNYESGKLSIGGYFYNENDLKNQSLEQDLSGQQKQILSDAGNDTNAMVTPSAFETEYSEDKILYKKTLFGTDEIFEQSVDESNNLFQVTFSYVGENSGNYRLKDVIAIGKIFEYAGENLGNYKPQIQLIAPDKLQLAVIKGTYKPTQKTSIHVETAVSNSDANLFSDIGDENNKGLATKLNWDQHIFQKDWKLQGKVKFDFINRYFKSIERIQQIEFNRNWNLETLLGDQKLWGSLLELSNDENGLVNYEFENLTFGDDFKGTKHNLNGSLHLNNITLNFDNSLLNNATNTENGTFLRSYISSKYHVNNAWLGLNFNTEKNERTTLLTDNLSDLSHQFDEFEAFLGVGDSTGVFTQVGVNFRTTDSVQNNSLEQVNKASTYYIKSSLIKSKSTVLNAYINYRRVNNVNFKNESSLNSKINYKQQLFNQLLTLNTGYQTLSGNLPQQDFTYIKTEPGHGYYIWIDYNENGIKELNEFEVAQFIDQASYLRIILPTANYIATHQNKFTQSIIFNARQWNSKRGFQKFISHFYNHAFVLIDNKQKKSANNFNLDPFDIQNDNLLGLNFNLNNSFYFNKGKQYYSTTYNFTKSQNKSTTTIDDLENKLKRHQLQFEHKIGAFWLFNLIASSSTNDILSLNYFNRNYSLNNRSIFPKLSYYYNENAFVSFFYEHKNKENRIGDLETLKLQKLGFSANYSNRGKMMLKAEFNLFKNDFQGVENSPVAYQMLEGLQSGKNTTWSLLFQQKLNSFLHVNINYLGRKSETSKAIHTGTVQLKALF